ncbi:DEKNAAC104392 [Brettanomyces naardenensis]|uniref:HECT-type E3 ubiquitin transferase n=1 Tax=Brettanomyces naardenensis TaxID=13370 RepID=A0A448YQP0_BRENA|nr:DEKNAAC104392 [Brettanomyces naardenensis]
MAHLDKKCSQYVTHWWSRIPLDEFVRKIDFFNLYVTFQLTRCINYEIYNAVINPSSYISPQTVSDDVNYKDTLKAHFIRPTSESSDFGLSIRIPLFISSGGRRLTSSSPATAPSNSSPSIFWPSGSKKEHKIKIKLQQYSDDWHLRTAARVLSFLSAANRSHSKVPEATFYNNLVDYINVKQDFDSWQFSVSTKKHELDLGDDPSLLVLDYLKAESSGAYLNVTPNEGTSLRRPSFTFCQFPFLVSLGAKITILEHEARRSMERKAEEAFIQSINKKRPFDVYFKIRVRRDHITNDSLRSIKAHQNEFKKLLKVEFVGEPGVDAGGLKKEWFLLLTKELFDPDRGLFSYHESSHLCYFSISPFDNDELYYLVGAVLGLAIYNSTILDLRLPRALYKKLMDRKVSLNDFIELDPDTGNGLFQLLKTKGAENLGIYYEVTCKDIFDNIVTHELVDGGSDILVNDENKYEYVERYLNFFLNDVCQRSFDSFHRGFYNVVRGNALSMFTPEEIQLILIGDESSSKLDTAIMKSVTKYSGFNVDDKTISWFWEYFDSCSPADQKRLLFFVTGTNRLPATGLPSLHFKITHLKNGNNRLPISHTCFNELCLYDYESQDIFNSKMGMALNYCEGFGLR